MGTCRRLPCRSIAHFPLITVVTVGLAIAPNNKKSSIGSVARPETKPSFPLDLANGELLTSTLGRGAANILKANAKASPDELAEWVFARALSRKPNANELAAAKGLLGDKPTADGVADLLWAVVMLPEFQLVY